MARIPRSIATLWTPPFHPPRHTPWGDSTRPHAVSALVWLRSNSQPGKGLHLGMDQACIDRGVDIQQLRCAVKGRGSKPDQSQLKKNWPSCPNARASTTPSARLINTSTSNSHVVWSLRPINHSSCWSRPPLAIPPSPPIHRFSLFFCVHSRHQLPSLRFSLSCRHHRQHFPLSSVDCRL